MSDKKPTSDSLGGRSRILIRNKNWIDTPLGPMEDWPSILLNTVNLIVEINFPIAICWGKKLLTIYNDAYRPLLGKKPEALGQPFLEIWSEAQDIIEPQINGVLNGEPAYFNSREFTLNRHEKPQKAWFDYTFSPIRDTEGSIRGIINIAIEVTEKIEAHEELKNMNRILEKRVKQRTTVLNDYKKQLQTLVFQLNHAKEQERNQIARFLHDNLGQLLSLSFLKLDRLKKATNDNSMIEEIKNLMEIIRQANEYTREFVNEIKPPAILEQENIYVLLKWLAQQMEKHGLEITLEDDGQSKSVNKETHKILYESVRELCWNIIKHANVEKATIQLKRENKHLHIIVDDSGQGFNTQKNSRTPTKDGGFGLFNIHEQLLMLGGNLEIESAPGEGTVAILSVPLKDNFQSA